MRTAILLLICCALFVPQRMSAQAIDWLHHYGEPGGLRVSGGFRLAADGEGHVFAAGEFFGSDFDLGGVQFVSDDDDWALLKYDAAGNLLWARHILSTCWYSDLVDIRDLDYDPVNEQIVVTGYYSAPQQFPIDTLWGGCLEESYFGFVVCFDTEGNTLWAKQITGGQISIWETSIASDGSVHVFGISRYGSATFFGPPNLNTLQGTFHAKYSSNGDLLSTQRLGPEHIVVNGVAQLENDRFILSGYATADGAILGQTIALPSGVAVGYALSTDLAGTVDWLRMIPASTSSYLGKVEKAGSTLLVSVGSFEGELYLPSDRFAAAPGTSNGFLLALRPDGDVVWARQVIATGSGGVVTLKSDAHGDVRMSGVHHGDLTLGTVTLPAVSADQSFLARIDTLGNWQSAYTMGETWGATFMSPGPTGIYFSCAYDSTWSMSASTVTYPVGSNELYRTFLIIGKLDSLSGFTGISTMPLQPEGGLHIYANPNKGTCTIDLPDQLQLTPGLVLSIVDQNGHLVQRVPVVYSTQGVAIDIRAQAQGIYHVELSDGRQRYTGRIVFE